MKAFIVVALLVASVAAQSMDLMDLVNKQHFKPNHHRSLSTIEDLLLKEKFGRHHGMEQWNKDFNMEDMTTGVYGGRFDSILSLEELVSHPLFREYMEIPLFRQFWEQYPTVFRKYVESPLFQKFWMVPEFKMYFRNPVYFYKYIVPQVKFIAETVVPTTDEGTFDYPYYPTTTTSRFNPYNTFDYTPKYNTHNRWSVPMTMDTMMTRDYPTTTTTPTIKHLLEKMINHLNMNKMGQQDITETFTDVKMLPNGHVKESTFGKMVNPFGQEKITFGDVKLVDEQMVPVEEGMNNYFPFGVEGMTNKYSKMNKIFGNTHTTKDIKDILLKHIILNKIYGDKFTKFTPEVLETLFGSEHKQLFPDMYNNDMIFKHKNVMTPEIMSTIFGENKKHLLTPAVWDTLFNTEKTFSPEILNVFGEDKTMKLTPELYEILIKGNKHIKMNPSILETIFGKKVYSPEVYSKLFSGEDRNIFDTENEDVFNVNKYNVDYEPFTFNKMNKFNHMSPLVTRMLKNKNVFMPKMMTNMNKKFQVEKMIEEMQKEKMMEKLIQNKEHSTLFKNVDTEIFPTMEEKMTHIPLTFNKPTMMGSGIEKFLQQEKEIKY